MAISVSWKFAHDEVIGFFNIFFSKFIVFYVLEHSSIDTSNIEDLILKANVSLDYYLHQNYKTVIDRLVGIIQVKFLDIENQ